MAERTAKAEIYLFGDMRSSGICGASNRCPQESKARARMCSAYSWRLSARLKRWRSHYRVDRGPKHCASASICFSICSTRQLIRGSNMRSNSSWKAFYFKPLRLRTLHIHRLYISPNMRCTAYLGGYAKIPGFDTRSNRAMSTDENVLSLQRSALQGCNYARFGSARHGSVRKTCVLARLSAPCHRP